MKIKTGDRVRVISGKDNGKEGQVVQVFPKHDRLVVEGLNLMTRHLKGRDNHAGQKISFPSPMHVSNVQIISTKTGVRGRVGFKTIDQNGRKEKIRIIRTKGAVEDLA